MIYFASGKILYTQRHTHTECGAISVGVKGCSKVSAQLTWVQIGGSSSRSGASKALSTPAAASGWELNYSQGCLWSRCKQSHPWDAGHVPSLIAALWPQSSGMLGVPGRALRRKGSEEDRAGQEKQPSKDVTFAAWSLGEVWRLPCTAELVFCTMGHCLSAAWAWGCVGWYPRPGSFHRSEPITRKKCFSISLTWRIWIISMKRWILSLFHDVSQIIMPYAFNCSSAVCQFYLNENGRRNKNLKNVFK